MLRLVYNLFSRHCLNCRDAARLISESCDRPLRLSERMKLAVLRTLCPYTARYAEQVSFLHRAIGQCSERADEAGSAELAETAPEAAPAMSEECRKRIRERLQALESGSAEA